MPRKLKETICGSCFTNLEIKHIYFIVTVIVCVFLGPILTILPLRIEQSLHKRNVRESSAWLHDNYVT